MCFVHFFSHLSISSFCSFSARFLIFSALFRIDGTYNRGLKLARGELITLLEGDGLFPKRELELQTCTFNDETVVSFGKYIMIDENHRYLGQFPVHSGDYLRTTDWLKPLLVSCFISSTTVMMKKEALLKVGGFTRPVGSNCVDRATYLELPLVGRFRFIDETLGIWSNIVTIGATEIWIITDFSTTVSFSLGSTASLLTGVRLENSMVEICFI